MSYRSRWLVGLTCAAALSACAPEEDEARPAPLAEIGSPDAGDPVFSSMGGTTETASGSVTGSIQQWNDDLFAQQVAYTTPSDVFVVQASGDDSDLGDFDGEEFQVTGDVDGVRWVRVSPRNGSDFIPTMTEVDLTADDVSLSVMPNSILDGMVQTLTTETDLESNDAHVVLHVVDSAGNNVIGVVADTQASVSNADRPLIAYREEDGPWQDLDDETNGPGMIFIPNLDSLPFPGQDIQVILSGTIDGTELNVRIAAGTLTFVRVVVP